MVGGPDANSNIKVANAGHNLPEAYLHQDDSQKYHDKLQGKINVGKPNIAPVDKSEVLPDIKLSVEKLQELQRKISKCH